MGCAPARLSDRESALYPDWGQARSGHGGQPAPTGAYPRQRYWGVPITLFTHQKTGELHPNTQVLMEQVAQRIEQVASTPGSSSTRRSCWRRRRVRQGPRHLMSGSIPAPPTSRCWSAARNCTSLAELYLEGSDQHRGWFQSSPLASVAMRGRALQGVKTHGFTVDAQAASEVAGRNGRTAKVATPAVRTCCGWRRPIIVAR
ncbi:MAG: class I tRNA ligase family protein [Candidatus Competibacteraceae bacterium]